MDTQKGLLEDLIKHVAKQVNGIGDAAAGAVAVYFGSLELFLVASQGDLEKIKNIKEHQILSDKQISGLLSLIAVLPKNYGIRGLWVSLLVGDFIKSAEENLKSINLDNLMLNPLLIRALNMKSANHVLDFFLYQSISRSIVTSWGMRVEEILVKSGAEHIPRNEPGGFDIKKVVGDLVYYIQVKSGTNTMNVDMIRYLNQKLTELETINPNMKGVLGLTYGKRNQVSGQIMGNLADPEERLKVGEELWDFISGEEGYFFKVLDILAETSRNRLKKNFFDQIIEKYDEIRAEWVNRYHGLDEESVDLFMNEYLGTTQRGNAK